MQIKDVTKKYNGKPVVDAVNLEIPKGKVATYGQIARLIGRDKNARLVGKILSYSEFYGKYPCHRVVNYAGRLAPGWKEQKFLLLRSEERRVGKEC